MIEPLSYYVITNLSIIDGIQNFVTLKEARAYAFSEAYHRPSIYNSNGKMLKVINHYVGRVTQ